MARETNGWGTCVVCSERLTPDDPDPSSDRCVFCVNMMNLFHLVNERSAEADKKIKQINEADPTVEGIDRDKAISYWGKRLDAYTSIRHALLKIQKVKADNTEYDGR